MRVLTLLLLTFGILAHAAPAPGTSPDDALPPSATDGYTQKTSLHELSPRELSELTTSSTLKARDSYLRCNYIWMGTAPFCAGNCHDIPVTEGTQPEQIVRIDHTLPCPTNTNSGSIRIMNLAECKKSESSKTCWTGTKVLCRYGCLGVISSA